MLLPRLCQPIVQRNLLLNQKAINGISLYRNASAWTRMKQFLKQHGTVFLVVKFGSFTPLMLLCYKIPSAFGYDGISEFILAQGKNKTQNPNNLSTTECKVIIIFRMVTEIY